MNFRKILLILGCLLMLTGCSATPILEEVEKDQVKQLNEQKKEESKVDTKKETVKETVKETEIEHETIEGDWTVLGLKIGNEDVPLSVLKEKLSKETYSKLLVKISFYGNEVSINVDGESKGTTTFTKIKERTWEDSFKRFVFTIEGNTLQIKQDDTILVLKKER